MQIFSFKNNSNRTKIVTMLKIIFLLSALVASLNGFPDVTLTIKSGLIIQGDNATGVRVKYNYYSQEIIWTENQDNLKVHFTKVFEEAGLVQTQEFNNICDKIEPGSIKEAIMRFTLLNFGNATKCPIKKGTVKITFPITFKFKLTEDDICGPFMTMTHIIKNDQENSNSPLLISILFRGTLTGC